MVRERIALEKEKLIMAAETATSRKSDSTSTTVPAKVPKVLAHKYLEGQNILEWFVSFACRAQALTDVPKAATLISHLPIEGMIVIGKMSVAQQMSYE